MIVSHYISLCQMLLQVALQLLTNINVTSSSTTSTRSNLMFGNTRRAPVPAFCSTTTRSTDYHSSQRWRACRGNSNKLSNNIKNRQQAISLQLSSTSQNTSNESTTNDQTIVSTNNHEQQQQTVQQQEQSIIMKATNILKKFDQDQAQFAKEENIGMGGGVSASMYFYSLSDEDLNQIRMATIDLSKIANQQRSIDQTNGRIMLGICAEDCMEGLATLKSWVTNLNLPRGLLHGMDKDGIPLDPNELGSVYIKYNSGGVMTFSEMRKSGLGFDSIWKPGDALLDTYEGDFRGVYFSIELEDGEFRQYGVLPLTLFDDTDGNN